jgi:hypothetical protein
VAARVSSADGRIARIVNTLEWISFNFGPTLLEWMEREAQATYHAILDADRVSAHRLNGHGNAIAQPYHHTILPLASRRDKRTEVRWGMADFRRRFGRDAEGMWLPETAVDDETLDVLAAEGIRYTIVAPHQVVRIPPFGQPGRYRTSGGRSIDLCVYDGDLAHGIAFGGLLHDALGWVDKMLALAGPPRAENETTGGPRPSASVADTQRKANDEQDDEASVLIAAATDGETYGHHHRFGEMALARALDEMRARGCRIENFAAYLARTPAVEEVELVEPTSWSCVHGVERWRADCGCRLDGETNPSQAWRTPLRAGLERLAEGLHSMFEREGAAFFDDPWSARDAYGTAVGAGADEIARVAAAQSPHAHTAEALVRARELLEMERDTLRMFTSCAWFFDDIGGIEPRQVLRYAARALTIAGDAGLPLEEALLTDLATARSNDVAVGTGADVYRASKPVLATPVRLAAAAVAGIRTSASPPLGHPGSDPSIEIEGNRVQVTEPRTGRAHTLRANVLSAGSTDIVTQIVAEDGAVHLLHLADLPERQRLTIRARLRRNILPHCLTPAELDLLLGGDATLAGLIRVALIRTIERLRTDLEPATLRMAHELLDLFEQFEANLPFDAQTAFWKVWLEAPAERRTNLEPLFTRLGFAKPGR